MRYLKLVIAVLALASSMVFANDSIEVSIDPTGAANPSASSAASITLDDDDFDPEVLARHAEMLKQNSMKTQEVPEPVKPALPTAPIKKSMDSYPWENTVLTTNTWRTIFEGTAQQLESMIMSYPELVHARSEDGRGALFWAFEYGKQDMIDLLVHWGADVNEKDANGKTPQQMTA